MATSNVNLRNTRKINVFKVAVLWLAVAPQVWPKGHSEARPEALKLTLLFSLAHSGSLCLCLILTHSGSLWLIQVHSGSLRLIRAHSGSFTHLHTHARRHALTQRSLIGVSR